MAEWREETVQLVHPVQVGGVPYTHITVREPSVAALEAIESLGIEDGVDPNVRQLRGLIAALAVEPERVILALHRVDFERLQGVVVPFLEASFDAGGESTATPSSPNSPTS